MRHYKPYGHVVHDIMGMQFNFHACTVHEQGENTLIGDLDFRYNSFIVMYIITCNFLQHIFQIWVENVFYNDFETYLTKINYLFIYYINC